MLVTNYLFILIATLGMLILGLSLFKPNLELEEIEIETFD